MISFRRVAGLPDPVLEGWRASLSEDQPDAPPRVLAWTPTDSPEGRAEFALGSPAVLSIGGLGGWSHLPWHTIERGGWNAENRRLQWRRYDGGRGSVGLVPPRRVPELFRERVAASIAVEKQVEIPGTRGVIISARRDLADPTRPLSWHTTLARGTRWSDPGVAQTAAEALAALRREYDIG